MKFVVAEPFTQKGYLTVEARGYVTDADHDGTVYRVTATPYGKAGWLWKMFFLPMGEHLYTRSLDGFGSTRRNAYEAVERERARRLKA